MSPFPVEKLGHRAERTRGVDVLQGNPRERRRFRTTEMKRAASKEWPPRSVKKSASKGIACGGSTRLAAARSVASVSPRGSSCASLASIAVSSICFRFLRSILPEVSLGRILTCSNRAGTI